MFDPTAFDNLKVVLEGEIYDFDLRGVIRVLNRKDIVDLARMSRHYMVSFSTQSAPHIVAHIQLETDIKMLSLELLNLQNHTSQGAYVSLTFSWEEIGLTEEKMEIIQQFWGDGCTFEQRRIISNVNKTRDEIDIHFNRLISEEMMDDLISIIDHTIESLSLI